MRLSLVALALFVAPNAHADTVFFFGGVASKASVISSCYPSFTSFGYPADAKVNQVIAEINASPNKKFTLLGHSSGAKYINQIASRVKNPGRITIANLDGFAPDGVPKAVNRICWRASNGKGLLSKNASSMSTTRNCKEVRTTLAPYCNTTWCLHFAMVNLNTPSSLNGGTFAAQGYKNCQPNPKLTAFLASAEAPAKEAVKQMLGARPACGKLGPAGEGCFKAAVKESGTPRKAAALPAMEPGPSAVSGGVRQTRNAQ